MSFLRRISTRHLVLLCTAVVAVAAGGTALAIAAGSGGPRPPAEPLATAVHDAVTAPPAEGVTARIAFTNHLVDSASLQGSDPILSGATGRLWATQDGRLRLELQSNGGDAQVVSDGTSFWVYDAKSRVVYRGKLPKHADRKAGKTDQPPTMKEITDSIAKLAEHWNVSGAQPSNVAGQPAYTVRLSPRHDGGLLGSAALAWDAARGTPLRVAVYAQGQGHPVLELKATDVSFGPVSASAFDVSPPHGAKTVELSPPSTADHAARKGEKPVTGVAAVEHKVGFPISAPVKLAGLPRANVQATGGDSPGAIVTYGRNLGGIVVVQRAVKPGDQAPANAKGDGGSFGGLNLPTVSIGGATGHELDTALGTVIQFRRGQVDYTVLGSVPPAAAEGAARDL